jgi:hypothetical protein
MKKGIQNSYSTFPSSVNMRYGKRMSNGGAMNQLTEFNEGGRHEENGLGGIPQGMNPDGQMNLVEEGETKFNAENYIFSDTLKVDKELAEAFNLNPKMVGKTFADASKTAGRKKSKREGDAIEEAANNRDLENLMEAQEAFKQKEIQEKLAEIDALDPNALPALMGQGQPQGDPAMGGQMQEASMMDQEAMMAQQSEPSPEEMAMMQNQMMGQQEGMMRSGGKIPKSVLLSRAKSHMSDAAAQEYVKNYENGGKFTSNSGTWPWNKEEKPVSYGPLNEDETQMMKAYKDHQELLNQIDLSTDGTAFSSAEDIKKNEQARRNYLVSGFPLTGEALPLDTYQKWWNDPFTGGWSRPPKAEKLGGYLGNRKSSFGNGGDLDKILGDDDLNSDLVNKTNLTGLSFEDTPTYSTGFPNSLFNFRDSPFELGTVEPTNSPAKWLRDPLDLSYSQMLFLDEPEKNIDISRYNTRDKDDVIQIDFKDPNYRKQVLDEITNYKYGVKTPANLNIGYNSYGRPSRRRSYAPGGFMGMGMANANTFTDPCPCGTPGCDPCPGKETGFTSTTKTRDTGTSAIKDFSPHLSWTEEAGFEDDRIMQDIRQHMISNLGAVGTSTDSAYGSGTGIGEFPDKERTGKFKEFVGKVKDDFVDKRENIKAFRQMPNTAGRKYTHMNRLLNVFRPKNNRIRNSGNMRFAVKHPRATQDAQGNNLRALSNLFLGPKDKSKWVGRFGEDQMRRGGGKLCYGCGGAMHAYGGRMSVPGIQHKSGAFMQTAGKALQTAGSFIPIVGSAFTGIGAGLEEAGGQREEGVSTNWKDILAKSAIGTAGGLIPGVGGTVAGIAEGIYDQTLDSSKDERAEIEKILNDPTHPRHEEFVKGEQQRIEDNKLTKFVDPILNVASTFINPGKATDTAATVTEVAPDVITDTVTDTTGLIGEGMGYGNWADIDMGAPELPYGTGGRMKSNYFRNGGRPGLWANIRAKKERMGKNYRPAKVGDPDRPDQKSWEKAQKMGGHLYYPGGYLFGPAGEMPSMPVPDPVEKQDDTYGSDMPSSFIDMSTGTNPLGLVSPMYNLGMGLFGQESDLSYPLEKFTFKPFDFTESKNALRRQAAKALDSLRKTGNTNPSNILALKNLNAQTEAAYLERAENINAQREQAAADNNTKLMNKYNKELRELRLKNEAIRDEFIKAGLQDLTSFAEQERQNEYMFNFLKTMAPNVVTGSYNSIFDIFNRKDKKDKKD